MKIVYFSESVIKPDIVRSQYTIGFDLIANLDKLAPLNKGDYKNILLLIDKTVDAMYGENIKKSLKKTGKKVIVSAIEGEEQSKDLNRVTKIIKPFFQTELNKSSLLVCVGGGVTSDIGGLLGSILLRGIDTVLVPTTLLSQVDASVGGKSAVNFILAKDKIYKNMLGTYNLPQAVISDIDVLFSLDRSQVKSGLGEIFKYLILFGKPSFEDIMKIKKLNKKNKQILADIVASCQKIKKDIVQKDPFDQCGIREKLNLGHTIGHAFEGQANGLSHGEAVVLGIAAACKLSLIMGILSLEKYRHINNLIKKLSFKTKISNVNKKSVFQALNFDKKDGRFILIEDIGKVHICIYPDKNHIKKVIEEIII